uniref:Uncharacterized protein n=1 Tax=Acrobeloides nanus TaxID=290746 RepID=A0A914D3Q0_9BILA
MYLAFGSLISYGNVHLTRFFADKSEKPKRLKELCKPSLFKIGPKKFIFHLHEDLFDKSTLICISQLNRTSQMAQDVWISVPAVKILIKKLVEVGEVIEKIEGDALKRMWPDKVLFEYGFLDCQRTCEITLKLLRAKNDWFGKFDLEIICEHLLDESNRSMVLVPSNVIHLFQDKLTEILNKYVKLQEPNRPQAFRLLCEKSFDFGTKKYCLYLNQGVKEICIFLNESKIGDKKRHGYTDISG